MNERELFELVSGRVGCFRDPLLLLKRGDVVELSTRSLDNFQIVGDQYAPDVMEAISKFQQTRELIVECKLVEISKEIQRETESYTSYKQTKIFHYMFKDDPKVAGEFRFLSFPTEIKH